VSAAEGKIIVKGVEYPFPDNLTIGESLDVEKIVHGYGQLHMMAAMVWIAMRRKDPTITFEQVGELGMDDFDVFEPAENGSDARPPARTASVKTRKKRASSGSRRSATSSGSAPGKSES
jgi:hypothetical protein